MRILVTSDLHFNRPQLDWLIGQAASFDLVVIAGDLLDLAGHQPIPAQIEAVRDTLRRLRQVRPVLVSSGNHDTHTTLPDGERFAGWMNDLAATGVLTDGSGCDVAGRRVTICPWWNGAVVRERMIAHLAAERALVQGGWIWVHHAPPRGSRIAWTRRGNAGDPYLLKLIGQYQPDLVLCGHIHEAPFYPDGGWSERIGHTWVFNPGKQPGAVPTFIAIDLETQTAEHHSCEGSQVVKLDDAPAAG